MITAETLLAIPILSNIPLHERENIASHAADIEIRAGDWLVHEGETPSFFALLSGRLSVVKRFAESERIIATYEPGETFGEIPLLLSSGFLVAVRAAEPSRIMRLEELDFRRLVSNCAKFREQIVANMATRIAGLQKLGLDSPPAPVRIIGRDDDVASHVIRDFLARHQIAYTMAAPQTAPEDSNSGYPIVAFPQGEPLVAPTLRALAERLGLQTKTQAGQIYDVVIVGAGPAGLAAGVYGASEGLRTLIIERESPGGQAGSSSRIENYLGFPAGISGDDLSARAWRQAQRLGAQMLSARSVVAVEADGGDGRYGILLDGGERVAARSIVLAPGVTWRKLDAPGIKEFTGRGVYYGAARSEAFETNGKDVFLVGGGNSAGQAAMFFANYARRVTLLVRGDSLSKSMSQYLIDELSTKTNVSIALHSEIDSVRGRDHLEEITIRDTRSNARSTREASSLFILIGADVEPGCLPANLVRDSQGYVCTGRDILDLQRQRGETWPLERDPYLLETSIPGIFAAGDVRHGSIKRVAASVGEGSMSIAFVHQFLSHQQDGGDEVTAPIAKRFELDHAAG